ncbi:MAG: B12-binding domain-containing radical SAM protein [Desulfuromonadaceae bacterium]|nr:B12-binding domain-containing radical SAM protein [Desulfuromonadaceae bacterium]MDD5106815.1 B12-binding domain-containing radical SAM protein [Desulfuromonadaceae bacterium]
MLVKLVSIHPYRSSQSIPLATAFLKSYAQENCSVAIDLIDFFVHEKAAACAEKLVEPLPDALGFSIYLWNRELCCDIAAKIRQTYPSIKLLCGGPEVTADAGAFARMKLFDFIFIGEGEVPFLSFCQALTEGGEYSAIPGIMLPGSAVSSPSPPLAELDIIPSPYLTGIIDTPANPAVLWQLSRGCSFTCDFCFDARGVDGVRLFSLERVEAELKHFSHAHVAQIFVLDSTFNRDRKRAKSILKIIKKHAPNIHFHFEVRSEFFDREMADLFSQIPCSLQIGLQSADQKVLKLVGRSFNSSDFSEKVGLLNESGAVFGFDLIYGLPGDTLNGFQKSLDYALSLYPNHLDIFPLAVLPGTRLAARGDSLAIHWNRHAPYLLDYSVTFSVADMSTAANIAAACDIFYTRGKAVAWFNAIITVLGRKPSEVLQLFSEWLIARHGGTAEETDFNDDDIWNLQRLFITHLFSGGKMARYLPLVSDIVSYHRHYAEVLLAAHPDSTGDTLNSGRYKVAASTRIVHFTYDIDELLECGEPNIAWMYKHLAPTGSHAALYLNNGTICTETFDAPYVQLIEQIRDYGDQHLAVTSVLTKNERDDFLAFALQEGIIEET